MTGLGRGIGLGRVLGIPVRVDLSWFAGLARFEGERSAAHRKALAGWADRG